MSRGLLIPFAVGICLWEAQSNWSIVAFVTAILCYSAIYTASMALLAMNREEKELCRDYLRKMKKVLGR